MSAEEEEEEASTAQLHKDGQMALVQHPRCSMADNDSFEWIDVLTCDVLAGDGSVQRSQLAHVARSTASWRVPKR